MRQDFSFPTQQAHTLNCSLYSERPFGEQACIIYVHGFKGFKDWAFVPYVGESFAKAGFSFLTFNFSHNGIGEDMESFSETDKFERNTFSLEVSELREVIQKVCHTDFFGGKATSGLGIIGHSRGGGISILASARQPEIQAVSTWAGVSTLDRYSKTVLQSWEKNGYHEVVNSRTGQVLKMGREMLQDIQKRAKKDLHILQAVRSLNRPLLVLHGQDDTSVPPYEAEQLSIFGDASLTEMRLIPKTGHTFGTKHPFEGSTEALDLVMDYSQEFFRQELH